MAVSFFLKDVSLSSMLMSKNRLDRQSYAPPSVSPTFFAFPQPFRRLPIHLHFRPGSSRLKESKRGEEEKEEGEKEKEKRRRTKWELAHLFQVESLRSTDKRKCSVHVCRSRSCSFAFIVIHDWSCLFHRS